MVGLTVCGDGLNVGSSVKEKKGNQVKINRYYEKLKPFYKVKDVSDSTLIFESRFESGNLKRVIKVYAIYK